MRVMKTVLMQTTLVLMVALLLSGCLGGGVSKKPDVKYMLTIHVDGQGSVTPKPGNYEYTKDTSVSLEATAADNWEFSHWIDEVADPASAETEVFVNKEMSITAVFVAGLEKPISIGTDNAIRFKNNVSLDLADIAVPSDTTVTVQNVKEDITEELPDGLHTAGAAVSITFSNPDLEFSKGGVLRLPIEDQGGSGSIGVFYKGESHWEYQPTTIEGGFV